MAVDTHGCWGVGLIGLAGVWDLLRLYEDEYVVCGPTAGPRGTYTAHGASVDCGGLHDWRMLDIFGRPSGGCALITLATNSIGGEKPPSPLLAVAREKFASYRWARAMRRYTTR